MSFARGQPRPANAGRKKGARNKRTLAAASKVAHPDALDHLAAVMAAKDDPTITPDPRPRSARSAIRRLRSSAPEDHAIELESRTADVLLCSNVGFYLDIDLSDGGLDLTVADVPGPPTWVILQLGFAGPRLCRYRRQKRVAQRSPRDPLEQRDDGQARPARVKVRDRKALLCVLHKGATSTARSLKKSRASPPDPRRAASFSSALLRWSCDRDQPAGRHIS